VAVPDWLSYGLGDAQIFSARAYDRLVERCMQEAWPAQPLLLALGVAVLVLLWRRPALGARALGVLAALGCLCVAAWWLPHCYADLHWATGWMAAGFALQAVLLVAAAVWPGALQRDGRPAERACGAALFAFALFAMPWLLLPGGGGAWHGEFIGLTPAPTVAMALALLPVSAPVWRLPLLPLPLAGTLLEAVTQASIGRSQWVLLPLVLAALGVMLLALAGFRRGARRT
jgi:hypothetical protein